VDYWADLASSLVRYGRYIAIKGQGNTGPIRVLTPVVAGEVTIEQDETTKAVTFRHGNQPWPMSEVHYIRGPARDYLRGDSPVENIKTAIGLEIACEEYGATFFENGALPLLIFRYMAGKSGFKDPTAEKKFVSDFQKAFSGNKRHSAFLLPAGMEEPSTPKVDNDKAQFTETRKYNQTVIAGAWNIPPHLVGNLENAHYNNVEQQDKDFTLGVIMPYIVAIESAMDRDLLTDEDREKGISARFNMDASLRADYLSRMQGYEIQISNAMMTPNEAREREGLNPSLDPAANATYYSANLKVSGEEEVDDADTDTDAE
jgi:HK97 family phage portal protein